MTSVLREQRLIHGSSVALAVASLAVLLVGCGNQQRRRHDDPLHLVG